VLLRHARGKESPQVGGDELDVHAAHKMKVSWPFGAALRGEASNRPRVRWLKTVVLSAGEKAV